MYLGKLEQLGVEQRYLLVERIEQLLSHQYRFACADEEVETLAGFYVGKYYSRQEHSQGQESLEVRAEELSLTPGGDERIDLSSFATLRVRSGGSEWLCYQSLEELGLRSYLLEELKLDEKLVNLGLLNLMGRLIYPVSERKTALWLKEDSSAIELGDFPQDSVHGQGLIQGAVALFSHYQAIEDYLYGQLEKTLDFEKGPMLYDLTNTYFEGSGKYNQLAAHGRSKEKRSDCPQVTLGLVLDSSGFPIRSKVFSGNASEPKTLAEMIEGLNGPQQQTTERHLFKQGKPTIVMDAGIATEENINWLKEKQYAYLVVSRKRHRQFSEKEAAVIKEDKDCTVRAYKRINEQTGEVELYCHSTRREEKEKAIIDRFSSRFEEALGKLNAGLHKKGCTKKYDKVLLSLGRLKERYPKAAKNYTVTVTHDKKTGNAARIICKRKESSDSTGSHPGVYCLRTNQDTWDESTLWKTYTMLTDLEAVFRSLKSELGLRPVFHQKTKRVSGHLFITLLAYHVIHTIRCQLKKNNIHSSWSGLREQLKGQDRVTVSMKCQNGDTVHIRKSTRPEPRQQIIFDALGLSHYPGRIVRKTVSV